LTERKKRQKQHGQGSSFNEKKCDHHLITQAQQPSYGNVNRPYKKSTPRTINLKHIPRRKKPTKGTREGKSWENRDRSVKDRKDQIERRKYMQF